MPALNFSVFKDKLVKREKRHTIRKTLPRGWKEGKPLSLYTGMRTKYCHKLVDTFCGEYDTLAFEEFLGRELLILNPRSVNEKEVRGGIPLREFEIAELAKNDGFESLKDFWEFFKGYKDPCYLLHFDMERFTPTQWALESLEKGVLK